MKIKSSFSRKVFLVFNFLFLGITGVICVLPFFNLLAISLSSQSAVSVGAVTLWP